MNAHRILLLRATAILGLGAACSQQCPDPMPVRLKPCPDSPNCVSSLSSDPRHAVAPIACSGSAEAVRAKLLHVIGSMPRTRIRKNAGDYLQVEFTSAVWRFVDDVEFCIDEARGLIQVRSASRVGYWDLGVNRRRVEAIRRQMAQAIPSGINP